MRGGTIPLLLILFSLIFAAKPFAQIKRIAPSPAKSHPPSSKKTLQGGKPLLHEVQASDLSIEKIYQKECKLYVGIVNRGKGEVSGEDYRNGKIKVLYRAMVPGAKGQSHTFGLAQVDLKRILKAPGKMIEFNTGITLGVAKTYKITAKFVGLKNDTQKRGKKWLVKDLVLPDSCVIRIRKPATRRSSHGRFPRPLEMKVPVKRLKEAKALPRLKQKSRGNFSE